MAQGADIIDIGGQSTRPGIEMLPPQEEAARVLPVIRALAQEEATARVPLSVDTFYADVAAAAVEAGATMVNDVSGGTLDARMFDTVAQLGVPYVLMHMRGTPATMQQPQHLQYDDVTLGEVYVLGLGAEGLGVLWRSTALHLIHCFFNAARSGCLSCRFPWTCRCGCLPAAAG